MIIPDNETAVDMIYSEAISATVAKVIRDSGAEPLTVGVRWGLGCWKVERIAHAGGRVLG